MKLFSLTNDNLIYQIIRRLIAVVILFSVLEMGFVLWTYVNNVEELGQRLLENQSENVAKAIMLENGILAYNKTIDIDMLVPKQDVAFSVYDRGGKQIFVEGVYNLRPSLMPPITSVSFETRRDEFASGFRLRSIRRYLIEDQPIWVSLVIEGNGFSPFLPVIFSELIDHVALPLIPLSCFLLIFNIIVVRRTLAPVTRAIEQMDNINPNDIGFRLESPEYPIEVRRLIAAMNHALERIEGAIRNLHNFTADTAHELRTPLAVMTMEVDKLPDNPSKKKLQNDIMEMTRLVQQMLDMAYADALIIPEDTYVDLGIMASDVIAQLTPLSVKANRSITLKVDEDSKVKGHSDALGRALRNIVENALAHTPENTSVDVHILKRGQIQVSDHGAGIPKSQQRINLDRFQRDEKKSTNKGGAGLGLAIAKRILEAHGGTITLDTAIEGGAIVTLDLNQP